MTRGPSPTDANKKADSKAPKDRSLNVKIEPQQFLSLKIVNKHTYKKGYPAHNLRSFVKQCVPFWRNQPTASSKPPR
ncbi:MAG: hypothetical protein AB8G77_22285, partial [Rhodothermales bacterium]